MKCISCNKNLPDNAKFCCECGQRQDVCPCCKCQCRPEDKFCCNCGKRVHSVAKSESASGLETHQSPFRSSDSDEPQAQQGASAASTSSSSSALQGMLPGTSMQRLETVKMQLRKIQAKRCVDNVVRQSPSSEKLGKPTKVVVDRNEFTMNCGVKYECKGSWTQLTKANGFPVFKEKFHKDSDYQTVVDVIRGEYHLEPEYTHCLLDMQNRLVSREDFSIGLYNNTQKKYIGCTRIYLGISRSQLSTSLTSDSKCAPTSVRPVEMAATTSSVQPEEITTASPQSKTSGRSVEITAASPQRETSGESTEMDAPNIPVQPVKITAASPQRETSGESTEMDAPNIPVQPVKITAASHQTETSGESTEMDAPNIPVQPVKITAASPQTETSGESAEMDAPNIPVQPVKITAASPQTETSGESTEMDAPNIPVQPKTMCGVSTKPETSGTFDDLKHLSSSEPDETEPTSIESAGPSTQTSKKLGLSKEYQQHLPQLGNLEVSIDDVHQLLVNQISKEEADPNDAGLSGDLSSGFEGFCPVKTSPGVDLAVSMLSRDYATASTGWGIFWLVPDSDMAEFCSFEKDLRGLNLAYADAIRLYFLANVYKGTVEIEVMMANVVSVPEQIWTELNNWISTEKDVIRHGKPCSQ